MGDDVTRVAGPPARHGHVCWAYDDPAAFDAAARDFAAEGFAAGDRLWYVGDESPDEVAERFHGVDGFADALRRGAVKVVPLDRTYHDTAVIDPAVQVAVYTAATEAALAAGHAGLRVVAEATPLVRTPEQRAAFTRYEHLIDRYMSTRPMTALCAYDRRLLGDRAIAELACMHPETNADVLFRLYADGPAGDRAALAGELDATSNELFATALERADLRPVDGRLVVRADDLRFVDHRSLLRLQEYAASRGATAVLHAPRHGTVRLVETLGLTAVRVEAGR